MVLSAWCMCNTKLVTVRKIVLFGATWPQNWHNPSYLPTYFTEQSSSWEANRFSTSQEIPLFYGTQKFIMAFTSARHLSLSWASSIQPIPSGRTKGSVQTRGSCSYFVTKLVFTTRSFQHLVQPPNWSTTPCRLSTTAYSIYSQPPSIIETVPPSATWRRAMSCWQGPAYHGHMQSKVGYAHVWRARSCHQYQWRLGSGLSEDVEGCELCKLPLAQLILKLFTSPDPKFHQCDHKNQPRVVHMKTQTPL